MITIEGLDAAYEKWTPLLRDLKDENDLSTIAIGLSCKMVLPAWYHKDQLEQMVGESISDEMLRQFIHDLWHSDIDSHVGELVIAYWKSWKENECESQDEGCVVEPQDG